MTIINITRISISINIMSDFSFFDLSALGITLNLVKFLGNKHDRRNRQDFHFFTFTFGFFLRKRSSHQ